jgi:hypothetical protein
MLWRAFRKRRELVPVADRTGAIRPGDILVLSTLRNEAGRLPWFLAHYRKLGAAHFLVVDNGSTDGGRELLAGEPDVSLWATEASYRASNYGTHWLNWLARRHGAGHWCLTVDPDEILVYPFCDTRPLPALTEWLDASEARSFGAMLLDMYPKGPVGRAACRPGQDPLEVAGWFDAGNYTVSRNPLYRNLWIQGGPRARAFFAEEPWRAPALNKIPLVKWDRRTVYASSTHALLPRRLNLTYDEWGGETASGVLLHFKFLQTFAAKAEEELARRQHYAGGREYQAYAERPARELDLWCPWSESYINWRQLEVLGLMSKGGWA